MKDPGQVDVALLPVGRTYTMDVDEVVEVAIAINARIVIPIHRFKADLKELAQNIESGSDITLVPLGIGDTFYLEE